MKIIKLSIFVSTLFIFQNILVPKANIKDFEIVYEQSIDNIDNKKTNYEEVFANKKEQSRAVRVSTAFNIDIEKSKDEKDFREKFKDIVDKSKKYGLNTIVFQVRSLGDAWYKSEINPPSQFILENNKQNVDLKFDPLKIAIEIAHDEGMELHAWFTPLKITNNSEDYRKKEEKLKELSDKSFAKQNPGLVYEFGNKLYLDAGKVEVKNHIIDTVKEVVDNYDVDAIHFDDEFYPYKTTYNEVVDRKLNGQVKTEEVTKSMSDLNVDNETFRFYNRGFKNKDKWREDNVNSIVKSVKEVIDKHNYESEECIQYGISPMGTLDDELVLSEYINVEKWINNEWVDYVVPKVYFPKNKNIQKYKEIMSKWDEKFYDVDKSDLYIGYSNYKVMESNIVNSNNLKSKLKLNENLKNIKGSSFYSYSNIDNDKSNNLLCNIYLKERINKEISNYYSIKSLPASKPWLDKKKTKLIYDAVLYEGKTSNEIIFKDFLENDTQFYVLYRQKGNSVNTNDPKNIIDIIDKKDGIEQKFVDKNIDKENNYTYAISILDKAKVESKPVQATLTVGDAYQKAYDSTIKVKNMNESLSVFDKQQLINEAKSVVDKLCDFRNQEINIKTLSNIINEAQNIILKDISISIENLKNEVNQININDARESIPENLPKYNGWFDKVNKIVDDIQENIVNEAIYAVEIAKEEKDNTSIIYAKKLVLELLVSNDEHILKIAKELEKEINLIEKN